MAKEASDPELAWKTYIEYGKRFERLVGEVIAGEGAAGRSRS
jgi:hypothetical protein